MQSPSNPLSTPHSKEIEEEDPENASYGDYEDDACEEESPTESQIVEKDITLSDSIIGYSVNINKKAQVLGVTFGIDEKNNARVYVNGESRNVTKMLGFLNELDETLKDPLAVRLILGECITKEIGRTKGFDKFRKDIEKTSEKVEVFLQADDQKVILVGFQRRIDEVIAFMYEKEAEFELGEEVRQELNISTFHRAYKKQIEETAHLLGLECKFGYDMIIVAGLQKNVDQVILFLLELESQVKRNLFPKYWDFKQKHSYTLIPVPKQSEEFVTVENLFKETMANELLKVTRVQNKFVMDHYICMLQKRMELNVQEAANRQLLFYSSKKVKPEDIYGNFDTGFDIQYGIEGPYGWGLYFSAKAKFVAEEAYPAGNSTHVMLLADVFIGKPYESLPTRFVKPPETYDCIRGLPAKAKKKSLQVPDQHTYVLYNNFYSYPLYIIEYK